MSQSVFIHFVAKARSLPPHLLLAPWFHRAARLAALAVAREERRRTRREHRAELEGEREKMPDNTDWEELQPALDEALDGLAEQERQALTLRFFQQHTFQQIGQAFGVSEDAARMRVNRALESLRQRLLSRSMTSTATALSTLLTGHAVTVAPPALVSAVITTSLTTISTTSAIGTMTLFSASTAKWMALTTVIVGLTTSLVLQVRTSQNLRLHNADLIREREVTQTQLEQLQINSDSLGNELVTLRENQGELQRLRGQVADLRRQVVTLLDDQAELEELRGQVADLRRQVAEANLPLEAQKVVVFGEMQGVIPLVEGQTKRLSEGLTELPRTQFANLRRVYLYRFDPTAGVTTTNIVNVDQILRAGDRSQDVVLMDGDRIEVRARTITF